MDLEHHQLDLRYEKLRVQRPGKQRRVLSSISEHGQQTPIVVVPSAEDGKYIVIDGYQRVRAIKQLNQDTIKATVWQMGESEALLLCRAMRTAESESALEQGWLLRELQSSFGIEQAELARRFDRSASWISRRLALVQELPSSVQDEVRRGRIGAHAAMKHLVPMARANKEHCEGLAKTMAPLGLSTREIGELYESWRSSGSSVRERLINEPQLFLKTRREAEQDSPIPALAELLRDLDTAGALIRRVKRRYSKACLDSDEIEQIESCMKQAVQDVKQLKNVIDKEKRSAESRSTGGHTGAGSQESEHPANCQNPEDISDHGQEGDRVTISDPTDHPAPGESGALPPRDTRLTPELQREFATSARGTPGDGSRAVLSGTDGLLPTKRYRGETQAGERGVSLFAGQGDSARHIATPSGSGG